MTTEAEFKNIVLYIQKQLQEQVYEMGENQAGVQIVGIDEGDIERLPNIVKYEDWKSTKTRAKKVVDCVEFQELWDKFPGKASFIYKGKKFTSEQAKRANYQLCKGKYIKILAKGKYTHQQILKAMLVEVETRKIESYKTGKNVLHYMNGLEPWLNQEKFEVYIGEEMPEEIKVVVQMESEI